MKNIGPQTNFENNEKIFSKVVEDGLSINDCLLTSLGLLYTDRCSLSVATEQEKKEKKSFCFYV